jgi:tripartite ATP-independent transporter DctP family solute receptor
MKRKTALLFGIVMIGISLFLVNPAVGADQVFKLKYGGDMALTLPPAPFLQKWADNVRAKSNGRVDIAIILERKLGTDKDMPELVRGGAVDMGCTSTAVMDGYFPYLIPMQFPFLIDGYSKLEKVFLSDAATELMSNIRQLGLEPLGMMECGYRHIANNVKPVFKPEDIKGMKIRVAETKAHQEMFAGLGAIPVPVSYGEIYTSLQTGVIRGTEINATSASSEKLMEVIKYFSLTGHFFWPTISFVNKKTWDTIPADLQKIIYNSFRELIPAQVKYCADVDEKAMETMKKRGIQINQGDSKAFKDASRFMYDKYMKEPKIAKFVNAVQAMK